MLATLPSYQQKWLDVDPVRLHCSVTAIRMAGGSEA